MSDIKSKLRDFSDEKIKAFRDKLGHKLSDESLTIAIGGSFARREASESSDVDYYIIRGENTADDAVNIACERAREAVAEVSSEQPSPDGPFGTVSNITDMSGTIGGPQETNGQFTRRILFLLEGDAIYNSQLFQSFRSKVNDAYTWDDLQDHQIAMFFLNDVIRYYRTVCVDFENKTVQFGKPWGIRNIKLIFSRKLLYFSGILVAAETAYRTKNHKKQRMLELFNMSPIQRIECICGNKAQWALDKYDEFLKALDDSTTRQRLEGIHHGSQDRKNDPEFRRLKNTGYHFTSELWRVLPEVYPWDHPIHRSLVL